MAISFAVAAWSGWTSETLSIDTDSSCISLSDIPDVSLIPPMLRRRLNLLGRACASQALSHLEPPEDIPVVYCSRHGDIERTLHVLQELVTGEGVSPTHFSLAVHNAVCGVLSIQLGLNANITAIASGEEPIVPTLLEAAGMLSEACPRVLCLICDVTLPEIYQENGEPSAPFAVSFVVSAEEGQPLTLSCASADSQDTPNKLSPLGLIEFLSSDQDNVLVNHNDARWEIKK